MRFTLFTFLAMTHLALAGGGLPDAVIPYKDTAQTTLYLHVFTPDDHARTDRRPCCVFFFGGGWYGGSPEHFYRQSRHLADKGMVAICPNYRVKTQHGTPPTMCVEDGKSAMRWIRDHAEKLGIDPDRIAAGGGSAGGHVAAATAFVTEFNSPDDTLDVSPVPDALVLFNPVIDNGPDGYGHDRVEKHWKDFSPMHNISTNPPPMLFMLGTEDKHIPVETAHETARRMKAAGGRCEVRLYDDQPHGFFNRDPYYTETVKEMDAFLRSLGYLSE